MKYHLLLTIVTLIFSIEIRSQTETCPQNLNHPDIHIISQTIGQDTFIREYILHIPQNYDVNVPTPLIINLHGFGDCASDYSETMEGFYNFEELANEKNIIVVYPQGAYKSEKEDTYWEPGDPEIENIYENDIYFIEELVSNLSTELNINTDMIFACGYSNGGMMAYSLACNRSNLFSAIGIMSGTMLQEDCTLEKPVPIIKFHGIADGVLPYDGNIWYQSVNEVVNFWLDKNGIPTSSLKSSHLNGGKVVHNEYSGGNNNSCLSLYTINEEFDKPGGHVWFSDVIDGLNPNRIMWNFFENNCGTISSTSDSNEDSFILYPNPAEHELEISNSVNQDYFLHDMNGILVQSGRIESNMETINIEHLQSGYYTIRLGRQISKFFKAR